MKDTETLGTVAERTRLVERLRRDAKITDPRVLEAFARTPRHEFLPELQARFAYDDRALPLSEGQTISQPTMIAIMLEALGCQAGDRVLEVGAGSGYAAALLAQLAGEVHAIEIRSTLATRAQQTLARLGIQNVRVHAGDGSRGLPEFSPFQRILVSAGAAVIPEALLEQLDIGGRIAIPVDDKYGQTLQIGSRKPEGGIDWVRSVPCMFVPLIAEPGRAGSA